MSGHTSFSKLREEIERDPVRRARMDETRKAYDALLDLADLQKSQGVTQNAVPCCTEVDRSD